MGKRKRRWIIAGACVLIVAMFTIALQNPPRFAFLDRFHPRRVIRPDRHALKAEMLVFPDTRTAQVLQALLRNLTMSSEFRAEQDRSDKGHWTFTPNATAPSGTADDTVQFWSGPQAGLVEYEFETFDGFTLMNAAPKAPPCCFVLLPAQKHTWFETQWTKLRSSLHL